MFNERNQRIEKASPAEPAIILGLNGAPTAGDSFHVMDTEQEAKEIANKRERVRSETAVIVPARGAAEALEHTVRTLESERYASGGFSRIIIADCGMDEDAQRVAQLLCRESFDVTVCPQGDLARQFD